MRQLATAIDRLDTHAFPASAEELIDEYGEIDLELQNGDETFGDALRRLGETTFESAEDARL